MGDENESRKLEDKSVQSDTTVYALDGPGPGGASHEYAIYDADYNVVDTLTFQEGPIQEEGVNGVMDTNLLAVLIDRLTGFVNGPYNCKENMEALKALYHVEYWLNYRTRDRVRRGVEGTSDK